MAYISQIFSKLSFVFQLRHHKNDLNFDLCAERIHACLNKGIGYGFRLYSKYFSIYSPGFLPIITTKRVKGTIMNFSLPIFMLELKLSNYRAFLFNRAFRKTSPVNLLWINRPISSARSYVIFPPTSIKPASIATRPSPASKGLWS